MRVQSPGKGAEGNMNAVVLVILWYFNNRLSRVEKDIGAILEQRNAQVENHKTGVPPPLMGTDVVEHKFQKEDTNSISIESTRRKRAATRKKKKGKKCKVDRTGVRKGRTVSQHTPHFYLKGQGRRGRATESGIFIWKRPAYRRFDDADDFSQSDSNHADGSFKKVRIHRTGVYYVFAKVTANGRSRLSSSDQPPMGIVLKKEGIGGPEDLDFSWVTQDEKGQDYGMAAHTSEDANYPIDTLEISGLFTLSENDQIYIQVPAETINSRHDRFLSGEVRSRFGAFLVEASSFG
ncbi:uncharacterized protein LOC132725922 isoform X3 [Ruditapes philippinarum]|uniref:uncharacterized protein LOC132725922 isoform X3 n=1 Tax=Ruditapes philippinarum TaxID=129788 RepID=UPI00295BAFA4|nr:uncharacterized protein LOC132725922 isoform X3 [Ruditapes philippinarum]XP_060567110.1 uncharacterized protein LOC132725922 isoform X3 [Ruditapes philippinarum]XP_060567111.1 uncharacterized protein LOC132725922 isoform X3 [Ruditapes philippinarum]